MQNQHVQQRLSGLQKILNGVHQSNASLSAAAKGREREQFVDEFLRNVLPPIYRFGTGDATDAAGAKSGQLDVVVEFPFAPSLPMVGAGQNRLYLAEGVAAVIEVKSDLANQWKDVVMTARALAPLRREFQSAVMFGSGPPDRIPLFAVGYTGWKTIASIQSKLKACPEIDGALVIDNGLYASKRDSTASATSVTDAGRPPSKCDFAASGPWALWGLITDLHVATNSLALASTNPILYAP